MNVSFRYILYFFLICLSCNKELDIEPTSYLSSEIALSTDQGVKAALVGAYDLLSAPQLWGGELQVAAELYASVGDQIYTGFFQYYIEIFSKSLTTDNRNSIVYWQRGYSTINAVNNVLESLGVVNSSDRSQVEAEARFIRAAVFFELINFFAKTWIDGDPNSNLGIPIPVEPTRRFDESLFLSRSTVSEVYQLVISDLLFARDNLRDNTNSISTSYAASGLLSRVYLMQQAYTPAMQEADRIIDSGLFYLLENYSDVFNQSFNTPEDIFTILRSSQDNESGLIRLYAASDMGGQGGQVAISEIHLDKYGPGDQRIDLFYQDGLGVWRTGKWLPNSNNDGNTNIIRLAEMYLTRAECRFRLEDLEGATEDLNIIRKRVRIGTISSDEITLDLILKERELELAFEGHALRDIKRTRRRVGNIPFDDNKLVFPIPRIEMELNPNLVQNPGY